MGVRDKEDGIVWVEGGIQDLFDSRNVDLSVLDIGMVAVEQDGSSAEQEESKHLGNPVSSFQHGIQNSAMRQSVQEIE
jgi:hypothetical protein